jgi:hypothetical protein
VRRIHVVLAVGLLLGVLMIFSGLGTSTESAISVTRETLAPTSSGVPRPLIDVPSATVLPKKTTTTTSTTTTPRSTTTTTQRQRTAEEQRVWTIYERSVPLKWRQRIHPRFYVIDGYTSWAHAPRTIRISRYHVNSSDRYLAVIVTHEYGHLIAFNYGSGEYYGAPPRGWPPRTEHPEEHWADCVQQVFLGFADPSPGLPPCEGAQLSWAQNYLR